MTARTGAPAAATPDPRAAVPVHRGVLALGTLRANKRVQSDGAQHPLPQCALKPTVCRGANTSLRIRYNAFSSGLVERWGGGPNRSPPRHVSGPIGLIRHGWASP
jgi:hypothetical protein